MTRKIEFPEIVSIREIIAEMHLQNANIGAGKYRDEIPPLRHHLSFILQRQFVGNAANSIKFGYFGKYGIRVRKNGEFFCFVQRSGESFGTYCRICDDFARDKMEMRGTTPEARAREIGRNWTFEAISRNDGKTLLIGNYHMDSGFRWSYHFAEFETSQFNEECAALYGPEDLALIKYGEDQREFAESFVSGNRVDIEGARDAGICVTRDLY